MNIYMPKRFYFHYVAKLSFRKCIYQLSNYHLSNSFVTPVTMYDQKPLQKLELCNSKVTSHHSLQTAIIKSASFWIKWKWCNQENFPCLFKHWEYMFNTAEAVMGEHIQSNNKINRTRNNCYRKGIYLKVRLALSADNFRQQYIYEISAAWTLGLILFWWHLNLFSWHFKEMKLREESCYTIETWGWIWKNDDCRLLKLLKTQVSKTSTYYYIFWELQLNSFIEKLVRRIIL